VTSAPLSEVTTYYDDLHQLVLNEFGALSDGELQMIRSLWWEGKPMTVQFRLHRMGGHLRQHTIQMEKTLALLGVQPTETQRLLRLVLHGLAEAEGNLIGAWQLGLQVRTRTAQFIELRANELAAL
jgi:hypothetical protein